MTRQEALALVLDAARQWAEANSRDRRTDGVGALQRAACEIVEREFIEEEENGRS